MELSGSMRIFAAGHSWPKRGFGMSLLISILITFLVIILILYLVQRLPLDGRAKQIIQVIVIVIGILSLLKYIAVF
jgi:hypothetical protein